MGKAFLNEGVFSPQVRARADARTCGDGCTYLRGRLQVVASEMGKRYKSCLWRIPICGSCYISSDNILLRGLWIYIYYFR